MISILINRLKTTRKTATRGETSNSNLDYNPPSNLQEESSLETIASLSFPAIALTSAGLPQTELPKRKQKNAPEEDPKHDRHLNPITSTFCLHSGTEIFIMFQAI
jgi:hypothetical protein